MPRGLVHQAESLADAHSLHLTISANQQRTWVAFLERALPQALQAAAKQHIGLRQSLPRNYLEYMGVCHDTEAEPGGCMLGSSHVGVCRGQLDTDAEPGGWACW